MNDLDILNRLEADLSATSKLDNANIKDIAMIEDDLLTLKPKKAVHIKKTAPKMSKQQIIDNIREIMIKTGKGYTDLDEKRHKRETVTVLTRILGELVNNGIDKCNGIDDETIIKSMNYEPSENLDNDDLDDDLDDDFDDDISVISAVTAKSAKLTKKPVKSQFRPDNATRPSISVESGAKSLFHLNKLLSTIVEKGSHHFSDQTGFEISGYTNELDNKKDDLLELYRQIYLEHAKEITKYVSPVNMVLMLNGEAAVKSLVEKKH